MTDAETKARLIVLEVLAMGTLGIVFSLTGPDDPTNQKALTVLDRIISAVKQRLSESGDPAIQREGAQYLDQLASELSEGLGILRRTGK